MRRSATAFVVAGLVALALAAGLDALRGERDERAPPATVEEMEPDVAAVLERAGIRGVITYSDEACRLHAVALPSVRPARAPSVASCRAFGPTGGITAWKGDVVWSGLGYGTVQVVLSKERISRAIQATPGYEGVGDYAARQAVSLGGNRIGALLEDGAGLDRVLALFTGTRLEVVVPRRRIDGRSLRPSPRGSFLAVFDPGDAGILVFTRDGEPVSLPDVTNPHAIAWSPDERWTALATRWSVYVFRSDRRGPTMRLPLGGAGDLAWGFRD
jgi:hypothetical protein